MIHEDSRNLVDSFKGMPEADIITALDKNGVRLEIAVENVERDFNMGSIVRTANAFGVRNVHVIGKRQWNKRGAMATDKYLHVHYYPSIEDFTMAMRARELTIIAIDNTPGAGDIAAIKMPEPAVLVFGSEGAGLSQQLRDASDGVAAIQQKGSTRSLNVAAAAAIAMYEWSRRHSD